jgi:hypothetical protein
MASDPSRVAGRIDLGAVVDHGHTAVQQGTGFPPALGIDIGDRQIGAKLED